MLDALIVGSGPLGAVAARRLKDRGADVEVLEQGPEITPGGRHLRNQEPYRSDSARFLEAVMQNCPPRNPHAPEDGLPGAHDTALLGGQGVLWTNNCPRAPEFQRWGAYDWGRLYEEAERLLQVVEDPFQGSARQEVLLQRLRPALQAQGREIRPQRMAGRVLPDGGVHYVAPGDLLEGIPVRRAQVDRLLHDGVRITGVRTAAGERLEARHVVVAAGALGTPELLWRSGIRPAGLGRGLSYHPVLMAQFLLDEDHPGDLPPRLCIPPTRDHPWHTMILRDLDCGNPTDSPSPTRLVEFQGFWPVEMRDTHAMDLERRTFSVPLSEADRRGMAAMVEDVRRLSAFVGPIRKGCEPAFNPLGFAHLIGSCQVTDESGRVRGFENLHLATVGRIPVALSVNPTLTAAALAVHTVDAL